MVGLFRAVRKSGIGPRQHLSARAGGVCEMDEQHLLRHLHDLRARVAFLRPLRPDNLSYKLWLGDLVELVNTVWGKSSPQMARISDVLRRAPNDAGESLGEQRYRGRLNELDAILAAFERGE